MFLLVLSVSCGPPRLLRGYEFSEPQISGISGINNLDVILIPQIARAFKAKLKADGATFPTKGTGRWVEIYFSIGRPRPYGDDTFKEGDIILYFNLDYRRFPARLERIQTSVTQNLGRDERQIDPAKIVDLASGWAHRQLQLLRLEGKLE